MMSLARPDEARIRRFLSEQARLPFAYPAVGATLRDGLTPSGFAVDRYGVSLGRGEAVYRAACGALDRWAMYPPSWCAVFTEDDAPPRAGLAFVNRIHHLGFWSLNSCRILGMIDEPGEVARYGFAFGTLPGHEESGEERFRVSWDRARDEVSYDVLAFSRPRGLMPRLGRPLARWFQQRFHRETREAMVGAVRGAR